MKILRNCIAGSREGTGIAPTLAGAIVPAGLCERGGFRLKRLPFEAGSARLEDHWRRACSGAQDIESSAANVHGVSDLWKSPAVRPAPKLFVNNPAQKHYRDRQRQTFDD